MSEEQKLSSECLFALWHNGHFAWYQRAFVIGDFRPGRTVRSEYVVYSDGRSWDPTKTPICQTCGEVPSVDDLDGEHLATGKKHYLAEFRQNGCRCENPPPPYFGRCRVCGKLSWPPPTNSETCWYCNGPAVTDESKLCAGCAAHLQNERRG